MQIEDIDKEKYFINIFICLWLTTYKFITKYDILFYRVW